MSSRAQAMPLRRRLRLSGAVLAALVASVAVPAQASADIEILNRGFAPDPAVENSQTTLTVDVKVDLAPYIVEFYCCEAIIPAAQPPTKYIDENSPETQQLSGRHTFSFNAGSAAAQSFSRVVTARVTDSTGKQSSQTFVFQAPRKPTPPPPPPPPASTQPQALGDCPVSVTFGLIKARATGGGCWQKLRAPSSPYSDSGVSVSANGTFYETTDRFVLNGIPFPTPPGGTHYVLAEPTSNAPGGQLGLNRSIDVKLGPVSILKGPLLWSLPTGATEGRLAAFSIPAGSLAGLPIGGQVQVIFRKRAGKFATSFPISVTLPSIFKPSPGTTGSITGATEITTDDSGGVSLDGGKIEVANAAIGKLALHNLCFSYLSANVSSTFAACEPPSLNGAPAVSCSPPPRSVERFDGAIEVELPTPSGTVLAAYGGVAGGQFAYGGGFVDNAAIPIVSGLTLERVGFGLCVKPTLLLKGDVGFGFLKGLVRADGSLTYAETGGRSFFVQLDGFVRIADIPVGDGSVKVSSTGSVDFSLNTSVFLAGGFIQVKGGVAGFIQPRPFLFNVDGTASVCLNLSIFGTPCATGRATVSSIGLGGCADFGFIGKFSAFFFYTKPARGPKFDYGRGCGFQSRVQLKRSRAQLRQGGPLTFTIPPDNHQYAAHFIGAGAPPKVRIVSPSGKTIESGPDAVTTDGQSFLIVENPEAAETSIFLSEKAAEGAWSVEPLLGSAIVSVETQAEEKRPTVVAGSVRKAGKRRIVAVRYAARTGDTVSVDVTGSDFHQTLAGKLQGVPCRGGQTAPGRTAAQSRCATIAFTPDFGFAGERKVVATVKDDAGATLNSVVLARYTAPAPPLPSKVPAVRIVRRGSTVFAVWGSATNGTERYGSYVRLGDGRKIGHTAPKTCFAWRIANVRPATSVMLRVQAGRRDLRFGRQTTVVLKGNARYAGPRSLRSAPLPRSCASI